mmetsp:Transcript_18489/g.23429  ORF Transcript_18489/g.23429 Transcript_18489/m.23429 type:complete len:152 (-) Transcript_18489:56-511(-)
MNKSLIITLVLLSFSSLIVAQSDCFNGTDLEVDNREAYCYYYSSNSLTFDYTEVYLNATSNNIYSHVTVWVNSELAAAGQKLADCEPMDPTSGNTCNTQDAQYSYQNTDGSTMYVLLCLECHFWIDDCDFDSHNGCMNAAYQEGIVSCPDC